ncbi:MAG: SRPBCC family protein [Anaerolineae bacterium]
MKITRAIQINAPLDRVFALVDDEEKLKLWMDGLEETRYLSEPDPQNPIGAKFKQRIREGGRLTEYDGEVTAYDKPHHLGVRIGNNQFGMQVDYRFAATADGTRLDYSAEMVHQTWFARLMGALFGWLTNRILDKQMRRLKELAEGEEHLEGD